MMCKYWIFNTKEWTEIEGERLVLLLEWCTCEGGTI